MCSNQQLETLTLSRMAWCLYVAYTKLWPYWMLRLIRPNNIFPIFNCPILVLCLQRCSSVDLGCSNWLCELVLPFYHWTSLTIHLWPLASILHLLPTRSFLFSRPFSVKAIFCKPCMSVKFPLDMSRSMSPKSLHFITLMLGLNVSSCCHDCLITYLH